MWFMKKIVNPLMLLILRSHLHGMMSAGLLLITYRGRKSGKEYTLPVQYAQNGNQIYILPGLPEQKTWWRNLKGGLPIKLTLRGQVVNGTGIVLDPESEAAEMTLGLGLYLRRFPALVKFYNVSLNPDGAFNADDLRKAAKNLVMIRVVLQ